MVMDSRLAQDAAWFVSPDANDFSSRMRRTTLLALQVAAMVGYVRFQPFDGRVDPRLILAVEALVIGLVLYRAVTIVRRVREVELPAGVRGLAAVRQVVTTAFPGPIGQIMVSEIAIWLSLWRIATPWRRRCETTFSYHRQSTGLAMLVVVLLTAPVELLLFELLVPWAPVRWLLLIATVYSVIWFAGFALAPVAHPHSLGRTSLTLRNGALTRIELSYDDIVAVERVRVAWPGMPGRIPPSLVIRDGTAYLPGSDRHQIQIDLRAPRVVAPSPDDSPVDRIVFTADEPGSLVAAVLSNCE
jgi:hypothetical protein